MTETETVGVEVPITGTTGRKTRQTGDPTELPASAIVATYDPDGWQDRTPDPVPIHVALARVSAEVGAVAKSRKNVDAGYSARSIDDLLNAVHGPMSKHGVVVLPEVETIDYETVTVGRNNTPMRQVALAVRYRFVGPAGDWLDVRVRSEALDSGDKATNKAMSAALKYALIQTLLIPVELPDQDMETHERSAPQRPEAPPLPEAERAEIRALLAAQPDVDAMRAAWKAAGLPAVDRLTERHRPIVNTFLADLARTPVASQETAATASLAGVCGTCGVSDGHADGCDEDTF